MTDPLPKGRSHMIEAASMAADDFTRANLATLCEEMRNWQDQGEVRVDSKFAILVDIIESWQNSHQALRTAQAIITRSAMDEVIAQGKKT